MGEEKLGQRLAPEHKRLWRYCGEVLHYIWDPIGVAEAPSARDEYESYVPVVFKLLIAQESTDAIANSLVGIETERMELPANREQALKAAEALVEMREWIASGR